MNTILVPRCSAAPYIANASVIGNTDTSTSNTIIYRCHRGHRFSDGTEYKSIVCQDNLTWNQTILSYACQSK